MKVAALLERRLHQYGGRDEIPDDHRLDFLVDVNVIGIMHLLRHMLPIMKYQGRGRRINMAGAGAAVERVRKMKESAGS